MATIPREIPSLDDLLEAILDRLPGDVVASLAATPPREPSGRGETFADQLVAMIREKSRARVGAAAEGEADDRKARIRESGRRVLERHAVVFKKLAE